MSLTADQLRGRARVLIDGEEKFLRFDQGALSRLVDELGLDGLVGIPSAVSSLDGETLSVLVWAGRLWEEPDLTRTQVASFWYPLLPTYNSALEAINLALWGEPEPEFGGSDDDVDPQSAPSGASEPHDVLQ